MGDSCYHKCPRIERDGFPFSVEGVGICVQCWALMAANMGKGVQYIVLPRSIPRMMAENQTQRSHGDILPSPSMSGTGREGVGDVLIS